VPESGGGGLAAKAPRAGVSGLPGCGLRILLLAKGKRILESHRESLELTQIGMLKSGILNPQILSLLARVRHTNALVIADGRFPSWPKIETVDISLVDDLPTVLQVLAALRPNFHVAQAYMAREFLKDNTPATRAVFAKALQGISTTHEPHVQFKQRVPGAIGLIRTGDVIHYANMILVSG
jgi:D-ribose pyranase